MEIYIYESTQAKYYTIQGRYVLTGLGIGIKLSKHNIVVGAVLNGGYVASTDYLNNSDFKLHNR